MPGKKDGLAVRFGGFERGRSKKVGEPGVLFFVSRFGFVCFLLLSEVFSLFSIVLVLVLFALIWFGWFGAEENFIS